MGLGGFFGWNFIGAGVRLALALTLSGFIEQPQTFFSPSIVAFLSWRIGRNHTDRLACRNPPKFITGPNLVAVRNGFGKHQLQVVRHFHISLL